jgi:hypothetical protein
MKNVLMILMIIPWAFLSTQSALAKSPERFTRNAPTISAGLTNTKYESDSAKSSSASADSQSANDKEAKAGNSSLFPYLFYALSIIGLLAVLSFDTSGNARSKRKSHSE